MFNTSDLYGIWKSAGEEGRTDVWVVPVTFMEFGKAPVK